MTTNAQVEETKQSYEGEAAYRAGIREMVRDGWRVEREHIDEERDHYHVTFVRGDDPSPQSTVPEAETS